MGAREFAVLRSAALLLAAAVCVSAATLCVSAAVPMGASTAVPPVEGAGTLSAVEGAGTPSDRAESQSLPAGVTPDAVVMDVTVHENGTASWEVVYRTRLADAETAAAFRSYRDDVRNDSTAHVRGFAARMNGTVRSAERSTGREMDARNFGVRAYVRAFPQRYGVVAYSFRWTGFAGTDGDALRVGDALSGLFLNDRTRLLVTWPEGYEPETVRPDPDERRTRTAVWTGPTDFAADQPRIVVAPPGSGLWDLPVSPLVVGLAAMAVLGAGLAGGWWLFRESHGSDDSGDEPPEDLLSNEERVLRLLERRGGRVKQKAVVDELGWTEAKTSQVVSNLRERGDVESFRLGRENVLALPRERQEP